MGENASEAIHLVARLKAKPNQRSELFDALKAIVPDVRREDGCLLYDLNVDRDDPDVAVMLESWRDGSALEAHGQAAPFRSLAARFDVLLAEPLHLQRLQQLL
ncbi:antibiotic biosynthesis monooxygenase protein (plasmid) [Rhizobium phaseoli]|uniref:putative quinol monooxygenase n=1 Tax=Rhizobium phaseoli TaxID=396 RepID=UPI0001902BB1|nr:putative quinol monooxygenase [Rhizobium phaseoli]ANL31879.1 antibiotic biosynthesis monooxygenase protein [Rhizobium phaseoli]ARM16180.1 antibiotic biosynthesis monooxygenase protein [Rhizobium phaseoli Brasil 5]